MQEVAVAPGGLQPELIDLVADSPESEDAAATCKDNVLVVFPDICPDHLSQLAAAHTFSSEAIISAILDNQETGKPYPRAKPAPRPCLKRKRRNLSDASDISISVSKELSNADKHDEIEFGQNVREKHATLERVSERYKPEYMNLAKLLLTQDFPRVPVNTIRNYLLQSQQSVFEAYTTMDDKVRNWDDRHKPWVEKKAPSKTVDDYTPDKLPTLDLNQFTDQERRAFTEFKLARQLRTIKDSKLMAEAEEKSNLERAVRDGQMTECGICFDEFPLNRMIRCEGETMHWFCRTCLRSQAETQIGMSRYELTCMSMDECSAGFSAAQKALFLDENLTTALDRIEQEIMLREAGIENLETCPFCPYAAEYPPVEVDKEFRCENDECQRVSCRMCRKDTHIPKSCAEADADRGLDARHILEEAMSEALIRQNPFVKTDGCNKIRCTKCGTTQCDVCRKTIKGYDHFNDVRRGGKAGQCPLFDSAEVRYQIEVRSAEENTRKKVAEENPEMDETSLHIPVSEKVQQDEAMRAQNQQGYPPVGPAYIVPPGIPFAPPELFHRPWYNDNANYHVPLLNQAQVHQPYVANNVLANRNQAVRAELPPALRRVNNAALPGNNAAHLYAHRPELANYVEMAPMPRELHAQIGGPQLHASPPPAVQLGMNTRGPIPPQPAAERAAGPGGMWNRLAEMFGQQRDQDLVNMLPGILPGPGFQDWHIFGELGARLGNGFQLANAPPQHQQAQQQQQPPLPQQQQQQQQNRLGPVHPAAPPSPTPSRSPAAMARRLQERLQRQDHEKNRELRRLRQRRPQ
ncbi:hypothetical protein F5Y16DRAFT_414793 [Xylariaceae sp. FL0255]|nr:hypothetical protein F5Y16DRAFT_414793 [Xylariaceae sp. FL0255]